MSKRKIKFLDPAWLKPSPGDAEVRPEAQAGALRDDRGDGAPYDVGFGKPPKSGRYEARTVRQSGGPASRAAHARGDRRPLPKSRGDCHDRRKTTKSHGVSCHLDATVG